MSTVKKNITKLSSCISEPLRYDIVMNLYNRQTLSVGELVVELGKPQNLVSYHLKVLKDSHMVTSRRRGKEVLYSLTPQADYAIQHLMIAVGLAREEGKTK